MGDTRFCVGTWAFGLVAELVDVSAGPVRYQLERKGFAVPAHVQGLIAPAGASHVGVDQGVREPAAPVGVAETDRDAGPGTFLDRTAYGLDWLLRFGINDRDGMAIAEAGIEINPSTEASKMRTSTISPKYGDECETR